MRIDSSTIGMESARSYTASNVTVRRFVITEYQAGLAQEATEQNGNTLNTAVSGEGEETKEESAQAAEQKNTSLEEWQGRLGISTNRLSLRSSSTNTVNDIRQLTLRYIFDLLFAARRHRLDEWMEENHNSPILNGENGSTVEAANSQANGNQALFVTGMRVLSYSQESWQTVTEDTSFSTVGTVRTKDGREINFNVNVGMSREFQQYYREDLEMASFKMCDPLVINLDTDVAELSDQNFYFDIDADGEKDEIAQLSTGSGYLALDHNGDGKINDGSELFGTASGNGFTDLAQYDEDGNGWIDEGDAVWSKLKIWCKDENGEDVLYRLADKGVGAICLQNVSTDFTLTGAEGNTKGAIRNTGIFLYENGNVGTVQHVDVAKYQSQA
ncbi:MAG: hypothetical protein E7291_05265 [Lachnospiraceae bacterium]|nr:hypothetical protein [Lachnospiraceae bacterium]